MKLIYEAVYLIIFLQFLRQIFFKIKVPSTIHLNLDHHDGSGEFYIMVNGVAFYWSDDQDEAEAFYYSAIARCRSLAEKLRILETGLEMVLQDSCSIKGLNLDEIIALDRTVDEFG